MPTDPDTPPTPAADAAEQAVETLKRKSGGQTRWQDHYLPIAKRLCETLGATDVEVAKVLGVSVRTLRRWVAEREDLRHALKLAKGVADERVVNSLYHRAIGYTHRAVKIFQDKGVPVIVPYENHVPPDTTACIFWLKNRDRANWRDMQDLNVKNATLAELVAASGLDVPGVNPLPAEDEATAPAPRLQ